MICIRVYHERTFFPISYFKLFRSESWQFKQLPSWYSYSNGYRPVDLTWSFRYKLHQWSRTDSHYFERIGWCGRFCFKQLFMSIHREDLRHDLWPMFGMISETKKKIQFTNSNSFTHIVLQGYVCRSISGYLHCQLSSVHDNTVSYISTVVSVTSDVKNFFLLSSEEFHEFSGLDDLRLSKPWTHKPSFKFGTIPYSHTDSTILKYFQSMHFYMSA